MSAALALSFDDLYPRANALQRKVSHQSLRDFSDAFHNFTPSLIPEAWTEGEEMYLAPKEKFCARDDHLKRISEAISRRLYPNTPLHQKVLADAIGVTRNSVNNWKLGKCDPGSHEMGYFFESLEGGAQFWSEIYGDLAAPRARKHAGRK